VRQSHQYTLQEHQQTLSEDQPRYGVLSFPLESRSILIDLGTGASVSLLLRPALALPELVRASSFPAKLPAGESGNVTSNTLVLWELSLSRFEEAVFVDSSGEVASLPGVADPFTLLLLFRVVPVRVTIPAASVLKEHDATRPRLVQRAHGIWPSHFCLLDLQFVQAFATR